MVAALLLPAAPASAQPTSPPPSSPESNGKVPAPSKPLWTSLTPSQQSALKPLAPHWNSISGVQKSKWLALSRNFDSMKPEDQATLHSRMSEWATLSAQQRALARLNFAEVNRLPADERKAKWEAYQSLSEDEKRDWAERANVRQPSAALPVRPVPERKLAPVPPSTSLLGRGEHSPRIQLAPPTVSAAPAGSATPAAPPAPVAAAVPAPAAIVGTPVPPSAEAQTPAPAASSAPAAPATIPPVRTTEQPSSAP